MNNLGNKPIIVLIGLIASIVSIYVFVSGKQSLQDVYREPAVLAEVPTQAQAVEPPSNPVSEPVLTFAPCAVSTACPNANSIFTALGSPSPYEFNTEYSTEVSRDSLVRFSQGWCTKDPALLNDHIPHLLIVFAVNGVSYKQVLDMQYTTEPAPEDSTVDTYCYRFGVGVSNWEPGVTYRINFGMSLDTDLYDGWENYPKGDYMRTFVITGK